MTWVGDGISKLVGVHYHVVPLSWLMWSYVIHLWYYFNASLHSQRMVWNEYILVNNMGNLQPFFIYINHIAFVINIKQEELIVCIHLDHVAGQCRCTRK